MSDPFKLIEALDYKGLEAYLKVENINVLNEHKQSLLDAAIASEFDDAFDLLIKNYTFQHNHLFDYLVYSFFQFLQYYLFLCYIFSQHYNRQYYILRKDYKESSVRRIMIKSLFDILDVSGINRDVLVNALDREDFEDFEDCVQDECAEMVAADYIVTRNVKDFEHSKIPAIAPDEFLKLL